MKKSTDGMTLVELLVTLAVMVALAALLSPAALRSIESARVTRCITNLKNIGQALTLYAADSNGELPCANNNQHGGINPSGRGWLEEIQPQLGALVKAKKLDQILPHTTCPTFKARYGNNPSWADWNGGYGINGYLLRWMGNDEKTTLMRIRLSQIPYPSTTVLVGESASNLTLCSNSDGSFATDQASMSGYLQADPVRHSGRANYLFVDGHVEMLRPSDAGIYLGLPRQ